MVAVALAKTFTHPSTGTCNAAPGPGALALLAVMPSYTS